MTIILSLELADTGTRSAETLGKSDLSKRMNENIKDERGNSVFYILLSSFSTFSALS